MAAVRRGALDYVTCLRVVGGVDPRRWRGLWLWGRRVIVVFAAPNRRVCSGVGTVVQRLMGRRCCGARSWAGVKPSSQHRRVAAARVWRLSSASVGRISGQALDRRRCGNERLRQYYDAAVHLNSFLDGRVIVASRRHVSRHGCICAGLVA